MRYPVYRTTIAALLASTGAAHGTEPTWTDITTTDLMLIGTNGRGAAWIDYDADGDLDLYVNGVGPNHLFRNVGGTFIDVTVAPIDNDGAGSKAAWGDMDNDGDPDVFISNSSAPPAGSTADHCVILRNDGEVAGFPVFVDITPEFVEDYNGLMRGAAWCDYDNNGFLDFYLGLMNGNDQQSRLVANVDGSSFTDVTVDPVWNIGVARGVAFCDYDNDRDQDLFVVNGSPGGTIIAHWTNKIFRNDGNDTWTDIGLDPFDFTAGRGVAWGDYDNDGDFDAYVSSVRPAATLGVNRLYRNDLNDTFVVVNAGPEMSEDERTRGCAWVDYDNDGDLDMYVTYSSFANKLFRNDGNDVFTEVASGTPLADPNEGRASAWADYDDDGDMDCYIVAKEQCKLIRNDMVHDSSNNWLQFKLTGTVSNRDSVGARIRVVAGSLTQIREIHREHGYFGEDMLRAHFGMGPHTIADYVTVYWPSGSILVLEDVPTDQRLDLTEPTCELDWDGDGNLLTSDFLVFLNAYNLEAPIADMNNDGNFDTSDFLVYLNAFSAAFNGGQGC